MLVCVRTTLSLDDHLVREAKERAAAEGRTLTSLVEEGLRLALHSGAVAASPDERIILPTSGGDGAVPGVDLGDYDQLKDLVEQDNDAGLRAQSGQAG